MSATETVTQTQEGQIPAQSAQFTRVPVNQTQIQQDPTNRPSRVKMKKQSGAVGSVASGSMAATSATEPTSRTSDVNVARYGPSNPMETMGAMGGTPPKLKQSGKLGSLQSL